jgi:hypothetical protein
MQALSTSQPNTASPTSKASPQCGSIAFADRSSVTDAGDYPQNDAPSRRIEIADL